MKAFKYIIFLVLILIIGLAIYIAVQPNSFHVERTRTLQAPAPVVYNNISDFKNWEAWSSWIEAKPETKITLSDQTKGVGGSYSWEDEDGIGTMKTVSTIPNKSIIQEMQVADFPVNEVRWNLKPNKNGTTEVTWSIEGKNMPFMFKAYTTAMGGMEKLIGPHYERGLELLDSVLVKEMKVYNISVKGITQHSGGFYLYNTTSCKMEDFKEKMAEMFPKIGGYALANNIKMAGSPFVIYHKWDEANNAVMFSCAIPTSSKFETTDPDVLTGQLDSFKAVKTVLNGDYENLKEAWDTTMTYIQTHNLEFSETGPMIETYLTDPMETPNPANWVTEIFIAVK